MIPQTQCYPGTLCSGSIKEVLAKTAIAVNSALMKFSKIPPTFYSVVLTWYVSITLMESKAVTSYLLSLCQV